MYLLPEAEVCLDYIFIISSLNPKNKCELQNPRKYLKPDPANLHKLSNVQSQIQVGISKSQKGVYVQGAVWNECSVLRLPGSTLLAGAFRALGLGVVVAAGAGPSHV